MMTIAPTTPSVPLMMNETKASSFDLGWTSSDHLRTTNGESKYSNPRLTASRLGTCTSSIGSRSSADWILDSGFAK
jgi:hypothetical protein